MSLDVIRIRYDHQDRLDFAEVWSYAMYSYSGFSCPGVPFSGQNSLSPTGARLELKCPQWLGRFDQRQGRVCMA